MWLLLSGSCNPQSSMAAACHYARADIAAFGGAALDVNATITGSVAKILNNDTSFDHQLMLDGVTDVRFRDAPSANRAERTPSGATPPLSGSPATTAVVTIAATGVFLIAALAFRRSRRKSDYDNLDAKEDHYSDADGGQSHVGTVPATASGTTAAAF